MATKSTMSKTISMVMDHIHYGETALKVHGRKTTFLLHMNTPTFRTLWMDFGEHYIDRFTGDTPKFMGYSIVWDEEMEDGAIKVTTEELFH